MTQQGRTERFGLLRAFIVLGRIKKVLRAVLFDRRKEGMYDYVTD